MFVQRDGGGALSGAWTVQQFPGQEELADDDAEILAFRDRLANAVPQVVTAAQIIRALDHEGLLATVKAAVTAAGGLTLELWNHAPFFHRQDPVIAGIAAVIGKTDQEVDALFVLAATF